MNAIAKAVGLPIQRKLRQSLAGKGPAFVRGAAVDLRFDIGRYLLNGQSVPLSTIDGYHSRASNSWGQNAQGIWQEFLTNQMEVFPGLGYDGREGHTNVFASPATPTAWPASGAQNGIAYTRVGTGIEDGLPYAEYTVAGTATGSFCDFAGIVGGISRTPAAPGQVWTASIGFKIIEPFSAGVVNLQTYVVDETSANSFIGGTGVSANLASLALQRVSASRTMSASAGVVRATPVLNLVNGSVVSGRFRVYAPQLVQRPYEVPFGVGTVAADTLVIPAADAGMAVNPSVTGITMFWRGTFFSAATDFPRIFGITAGSDTRLSVIYRAGQGFRMDRTLLGVTTTTSTSAGIGVERSIVATMRPDGSARLLGVGAPQSLGAREVPSLNNLSVEVGVSGAGANPSNAIHRRVGFLPYALSDADALALFNRINQGL